MANILIVDDEREYQQFVSVFLRKNGYETEIASTGQEALVKAGSSSFDIVLMDLVMPGIDGLETLLKLRDISPRSRVIMLTGFASVDTAIRSMKGGAAEFMPKPIQMDNLLNTIRRLLKEASFEIDFMDQELDQILSSLANPIRRRILFLMCDRFNHRTTALTEALDFDDHTKVLFHLRHLKEAQLVEQHPDRSYTITNLGLKTVKYMNMIQGYINS